MAEFRVRIFGLAAAGLSIPTSEGGQLRLHVNFDSYKDYDSEYQHNCEWDCTNSYAKTSFDHCVLR